MNSENVIKQLIQKKYRNKFNKQISENGYVARIEDNLINGISRIDFEEDLSSGSGNELESKFLALHSSSALAINSFAYFKSNLNKLHINGHGQFENICFEKKLPTGLGGTPPNIDIFLHNSRKVVGIESKFLETLTKKKPNFSSSYNSSKLSYLNKYWFELIDKYSKREKMYLDTAQLIKHAIGLIKNFDKKLDRYLVYLYWQPVDINKYKEYKIHRQELEEFDKNLKKTEIIFEHLSYQELWEEWSNIEGVKTHCNELKNRYLI